MKTKLLQIVQRYPLFLRIFLHLMNRINGGKISFPDTGFRKNTVTIDGDSSMAFGAGCDIQRNRMMVRGKGNKVIAGKNVKWYGENGHTSLIVNGNNNTIIIEDDCRFTNVQFYISGSDNIIHVHAGCSAVYTTFHIEQDSNPAPNRIEVNEGTTMHGRQFRTIEMALDEGTSLTIGKDCMFSNDIQIRTTDSHSVTTMDGKRTNYAKNIVIGDHCWVGLGAIILKGTQICEHTVVAAGSICSGKYTVPNTVIAGNPAKIVKKDIDWQRKQI